MKRTQLIPALGVSTVGLVALGVFGMQTAAVGQDDGEVGKRDDDRPTLTLVDDSDDDGDDGDDLTRTGVEQRDDDDSRDQSRDHTRDHTRDVSRDDTRN